MTRAAAVPVLLLLLAAAACRPAAADLPVDTETVVIQEIAAQFDTLRAAVVARDWDALAPRLAGGEAAAATIDGAALVGRDAIVARFRADSSVREHLEFRFGDTRITPLGTDAAMHSTSVRERLALRSGETVEVAGTWTSVFRRIDGRWRIVHLSIGHVQGARAPR